MSKNNLYPFLEESNMDEYIIKYLDLYSVEEGVYVYNII